jgi:hypothetical protein
MNYNQRQDIIQLLQIFSLALGIAVAIKTLNE